jgi:DNA-binding MarR family transcriptional regulator
MLSNGLIEESDNRPDPELDDERCRYYRLTNLGRHIAGAEANRLQRLLSVAHERDLLDGPLTAQTAIVE